MEEKYNGQHNIGMRCARYFEERNNHNSGKTLNEQGRMCYSICRGVDNPVQPICDLYIPLSDIQLFNDLFFQRKT